MVCYIKATYVCTYSTGICLFVLIQLSSFVFHIAANFRGYMSSCYHNPCDDLSHVTTDRLQFMAKVSDSLYRSLDQFTGKDATSSAAFIWSLGKSWRRVFDKMSMCSLNSLRTLSSVFD